MSQDRTWLLLGRKISGEATLDELRELELLLKENAHLSYQASLMKELEMKTPDLTAATETLLEKHMQRMQMLFPGDFPPAAHEQEEEEQRPRRKGVWIMAVTAAILAVAGGIWGLRTPKKTEGPQLVSEITTRHGSRSKVTLPDGSTVHLNVSSRLTYDYSKDDSRQVTLDGEAFFDVEKDEQRPFVIHTGKMDITVLGTSFNVRAYKGDKTTETSLIQGKVEVTIKGDILKKVILSPLQKIVLYNSPEQKTDRVPAAAQPEKEDFHIGEVSVSQQDSLVAETAWKENYLVFNNERFEEIAVRLERWYDMQVVFEDEDMKQARFTGTFINETISETLEALRFTSPFHYTIDKKKIIIKR
ncbi:FecR family protein [Chitinophaga tropicalis]|uniref:DUF4974 domain-containing protein n=1 Tax=Chitinophaga tropicalis TaxID=2683588 RepID=A0A7K1UAY4_9BACT|nr:FecR domain-containing protein [Chitinophaga tropicalis]MVT11534.1 DUF4974 domain-containing protein [Chitinophaga tropicalis]